ncbi:C2H2-type zinc finger protein [Natronomonas halophila]|uniref:C2H2-type zinc finger protein n=1 Tax=Natronomonas halophila TaxID=2747817 RepID=UPI001BAABE65|nr:C2H2-type zinc finger protein [Natronomonas halophila]
MSTENTPSESTRTPPPDAPDEPATCEYCGERFVEDDLLALHRGQAHEGDLNEAEIEAYREARESERDEVRLFRLQALAALVAIYFGFIFVYAFVI